jgi:hypothetical protein
MAGHWSGTKAVLSDFGVLGIKEPNAGRLLDRQSVGASSDVKLRVQSLPAGTHRHAVANECMRKLSKHAALSFCSGVADFCDIANAHADVLASPAKYHVWKELSLQ